MTMNFNYDPVLGLQYSCEPIQVLIADLSVLPKEFDLEKLKQPIQWLEPVEEHINLSSIVTNAFIQKNSL